MGPGGGGGGYTYKKNTLFSKKTENKPNYFDIFLVSYFRPHIKFFFFPYMAPEIKSFSTIKLQPFNII